MLERIIEPIRAEMELFEERLKDALSSEVNLVHQIAQYLLLIRGKRFRPALTLLTAKAAGKINASVVDAAVVVELIHTATLTHDDVIDSSQMRRGGRSVNSIWDNQVSVLMGDFLFSKALCLLVDIGSNTVNRAISTATERISRGEILEIEQKLELDMSEQTYFQIISDKTASLLSAATRSGAILGGASPDSIEVMTKYGEDLGLAYQITDDLLDFTGDSSVVGKPVGHDIKDGKVTLPLIRAFSNCRDGEADEIKQKIQNGLEGSDDWKDLIDFVNAKGGIDYAREKAGRLVQMAVSRLEYFEESEAVDTLKEAVRYVTQRRS